jgi:hypothetical protein
MNEKTPLEWIEMKIMTGTRNSLGPSVNWGEKYCIRISVAFRLYLVKIIQILTN